MHGTGLCQWPTPLFYLWLDTNCTNQTRFRTKMRRQTVEDALKSVDPRSRGETTSGKSSYRVMDVYVGGIEAQTYEYP
jgi:hypothetical protein